jgi:hypothetical protein
MPACGQIRNDVDPFLTGVGCRTTNRFPTCDVTTAMGATVIARPKMVRTTTTSTTGGYVQLPNGTWDVRIVGGGLPDPWN